MKSTKICKRLFHPTLLLLYCVKDLSCSTNKFLFYFICFIKNSLDEFSSWTIRVRAYVKVERTLTKILKDHSLKRFSHQLLELN